MIICRYRQPFKSRCLSLPGNKKAPYCYDAFVLLGSWSKGTLFHYLLCFFQRELFEE